ncbi:MAG: bacillithiol biosynthesis deacetylase BshB1 [Bacillota bacterium]
MTEVIAFGAHPDDAEIGMGGTLALLAASRRVGIVDLSAGELASNGTAAVRLQEGRTAADILGVAWRKCLGLPDSRLDPADPTQVEAIVAVLRSEQPAVVFSPEPGDRHPDHVAAAALVTRACFLSGLLRYGTGKPHRPLQHFHYLINSAALPDFVVDVTAQYDRKEESLAAHASQFCREGGWPTALNDFGFPQLIRARDEYLGARIGARRGEGFTSREPLGLSDPSQLWSRPT